MKVNGGSIILLICVLILKIVMKTIIIQLPEGLKPKFKQFYEKYKNKGEVIFWAGSNFGACDLPILPKEMKNTKVINIGHNAFPPKV